MPSSSRITPDRAVMVGMLLAAVAYCRDLRYGFVLDDVPLVLMNETIASWRNWKLLFLTHIFAISVHFPTPSSTVHYRPVYMLWMMMNQQLFGSVVPWWHLTSLLLHISVIFLVYQVGRTVLHQAWTAALAALLFAFHPIHVESVAYVSASTDLLVTLFLLISFLAYSRFREQRSSHPYFYLLASVFAAALAMLSKETAVMFPWILVAYEAMREAPPGTRHRWRRFVWTLPFFAIVLVYAVIRTALFGRNLGPGPGGNRQAALLDIPLVLIAYLRNLLWSFRLSFIYPVEWGSQWTVGKGVAVVLVIATAVFLWNSYRDSPGVRLQFLWMTLFLVPALIAVTTFAKEDWVHDRHMYLVSVPFCLIAATLLTGPRFSRNTSVIISSLILLTLFLETTVQIPRFSDELTLYQSTLAVAPRSVLAHGYYASALWNYGHYEAALRELRVTTELSPENPTVYGDYAAALAELGRDQQAETEYAAALHWAPSPTPYRALLLYRLATIEVKHSESEAAAGHSREALWITPQVPDYHAVLAQALNQQGYTEEASEEMQLEAIVRQRSLSEVATPRK